MAKCATATAATTATIAATKPEKSLSDIARQPVWKVSEAALVLRCNQATVRREIKRGTITGVRIGNEWRLPANQFSELARAVKAMRSVQNGEVKTSGAVALIENDDVLSSPGQPDIATQSQAQAQAEHTLRIYLLGRPRIYIDDVRISELERSNRRSQVIQLLALHRAGLSGEKLAGSLNMSSHQYEDERLAPNYVRNLVWGTREQARRRTGWGGIIESPMQCGVGLHYYRLPDNTICDMWEFEDKLDEADRLLARAVALPASGMASGVATGQASGEVQGEARGDVRMGVIERAAALREDALQLYKGEFCEGLNNGCIAQAARVLEERYLRAALQQGDYWRATALRLQETQVVHSSALGTGPMRMPTHAHLGQPIHPEVQMIWREALRNYERVLNVDNYHEEAYMYAMECYAHLGNARGVDRIFMRCQDVLHADLLQAPGDDVVRTYGECKTLLNVTGMVAQRP